MKRYTTIYIIAQISLLFAGTLVVHWIGRMLTDLDPNYGWALPVLRHYSIPGWTILGAIVFSGVSMAVCGWEKRRASSQQYKDACNLNQ